MQVLWPPSVENLWHLLSVSDGGGRVWPWTVPVWMWTAGLLPLQHASQETHWGEKEKKYNNVIAHQEKATLVPVWYDY